MGIQKEELADDGVGGEVVNLVAEKDDALAKEQTEGVARLLTRHNHAAGADRAHEVRIHFGGEAIGGKRRARRDVQATEARGSCRAPRRGAAGTLDQGGTSEGHPLRQRGESEGGHGAGSLARQEVCYVRNASFFQIWLPGVRASRPPARGRNNDVGARRRWRQGLGEKITITKE